MTEPIEIVIPAAKHMIISLSDLYMRLECSRCHDREEVRMSALLAEEMSGACVIETFTRHLIDYCRDMGWLVKLEGSLCGKCREEQSDEH